MKNIGIINCRRYDGQTIPFLIRETIDGDIEYTSNHKLLKMNRTGSCESILHKYRIIIDSILEGRNSLQPGHILDVLYETESSILCRVVDPPSPIIYYNTSDNWCIKTDNTNNNVFIIGYKKKYINYTRTYNEENLNYIDEL